MTPARLVLWIIVAVLGAIGFGVLALGRGETVSCPHRLFVYPFVNGIEEDAISAAPKAFMSTPPEVTVSTSRRASAGSSDAHACTMLRACCAALSSRLPSIS